MSTEQQTVTRTCDVCGRLVYTHGVGNFPIRVRHDECLQTYRARLDATDHATLNAARVRQAAPALLAALKALVAAVDKVNIADDVGYNSVAPTLRAAHAAIAQAEGAPAANEQPAVWGAKAGEVQLRLTAMRDGHEEHVWIRPMSPDEFKRLEYLNPADVWERIWQPVIVSLISSLWPAESFAERQPPTEPPPVEHTIIATCDVCGRDVYTIGSGNLTFAQRHSECVKTPAAESFNERDGQALEQDRMPY